MPKLQEKKMFCNLSDGLMHTLLALANNLTLMDVLTLLKLLQIRLSFSLRIHELCSQEIPKSQESWDYEILQLFRIFTLNNSKRLSKSIVNTQSLLQFVCLLTLTVFFPAYSCEQKYYFNTVNASGKGEITIV